MARRRPRVLGVLQHRDYRIVQTGSTISSLGTWWRYVAVGWAVRSLSDSELALGVAFAAAYGPSLLVASVGGVLADRLDRRHVVMVGNTVQSLMAFTLGLLVATGELTLWRLYLVAGLGGTAEAFTAPSNAALVPVLVPMEMVPQAVSFTSGMSNLTRVVGPAVGGVVIRVAGLDWAFYGDALSYLAVVVAWAFVRPARTRADTPSEPFGRRLRAGLAQARRTPVVMRALALAGLVSLLTLHGVLMPAYATEVLGGGVTTYSVLSGAAGVGATVGAFASGELVTEASRARAVLVGSLVLVPSALLFAASRVVVLSFVLLVGIGFGYFLTLTTLTASVTLAVADEYRGRVMGLYQMVWSGSIPVAGLLGGGLGAVLGVPWAIASGALALGAGVVWFFATGGLGGGGNGPGRPAAAGGATVAP